MEEGGREPADSGRGTPWKGPSGMCKCGKEKTAGGTSVAWHGAQFRRFFGEKEGGIHELRTEDGLEHIW